MNSCQVYLHFPVMWCEMEEIFCFETSQWMSKNILENPKKAEDVLYEYVVSKYKMNPIIMGSPLDHPIPVTDAEYLPENVVTKIYENIISTTHKIEFLF